MASSLYLARLNVLADGPSLFSSMSTPSELPSDKKSSMHMTSNVSKRVTQESMPSGWLKANLLRLRPAVSTESSVRLSADEEDNSESSSFSHLSGGAGKGQFFGNGLANAVNNKVGTSATKAETNLWFVNHLLYVMV